MESGDGAPGRGFLLINTGEIWHASRPGMVTQYAFLINSDACSGCKTCQVACKDRNDLPAGLHWRSVYEVVGGDWQASPEGAWTSTVAGYNLSVACHPNRHQIRKGSDFLSKYIL